MLGDTASSSVASITENDARYVGSTIIEIAFARRAGLKHLLGYDDAVNAFGVHAVGVFVGVLLTGVFAVEAYCAQPGLFEGNPGQVLNQLYGIVIAFAYAAIGSLSILKLVDIFIGLRVSDEAQPVGHDLSLHGEVIPRRRAILDTPVP